MAGLLALFRAWNFIISILLLLFSFFPRNIDAMSRILKFMTEGSEGDEAQNNETCLIAIELMW